MSNAYEYRVVTQREGYDRKVRRYRSLAAAQRRLLLYGPEPWLAYGVDPDAWCCSGAECACGGRTERQNVADLRANLPPLLFARIERRPIVIGAWESFAEAPKP